MRGDDAHDGVTAGPVVGSPPRAWGRLAVSRKTYLAPAVHPHVRGDDRGYTRWKVDVHGSPPRAWGRREALRVNGAGFGSPPRAWGRRAGAESPPPRLAVHPHVRGDDYNTRTGVATVSRFTPTCVGTTAWSTRTDRVVYGSPPRAWGRRGRRSGDRTGNRFTPTCVGTTGRTRSRPPSRAVHPHVRGDDNRPVQPRSPPFGSPPRAWGRRSSPTTREAAPRFTPTCVGTTLELTTWMINDFGSPPRAWGRLESSVPRKGHFLVHPHVRGDDFKGLWDSIKKVGSPPRAWGRLHPVNHAGVVERFTPTCVGTTRFAVTTRRNDNGSPPRAWGRLILVW